MDAKAKGVAVAVADARRVLLKSYDELPGQEDFKEVGKEDFFGLTDHSTNCASVTSVSVLLRKLTSSCFKRGITLWAHRQRRQRVAPPLAARFLALVYPVSLVVVLGLLRKRLLTLSILPGDHDLWSGSLIGYDVNEVVQTCLY